jgi:hypothetical protein
MGQITCWDTFYYMRMLGVFVQVESIITLIRRIFNSSLSGSSRLRTLFADCGKWCIIAVSVQSHIHFRCWACNRKKKGMHSVSRESFKEKQMLEKAFWGEPIIIRNWSIRTVSTEETFLWISCRVLFPIQYLWITFSRHWGGVFRTITQESKLSSTYPRTGTNCVYSRGNFVAR